MSLRASIVVTALLASAATVYTNAAPASALAQTTRVSVDTSGGNANDESSRPSISANGRYVAFASYATNLVAGGGTDVGEIYVRDLTLGTTTRASVSLYTGADPNDESIRPSISADGRYVAFASWASDLVAGDHNDELDVFVRDLVNRTTTRVSVDLAGGDADDASSRPSISADGRYVAFTSRASDLVTGDDNEATDVFVRDLTAGTTTRVSVGTGGLEANGESTDPSISSDGRYVAFASDAENLVAGDHNWARDVFVRDRTAATTTRVSVNTSASSPNADSNRPSISGDGRYVAFESWASDLVAGDANSTADVFVRDVIAGTTTRASVNVGGTDASDASQNPSITSDGHAVAFESWATNLVASGDTNRHVDVYVRDLTTRTTARLSTSSTGGEPNGHSTSPRLAADGLTVAFESEASNLVTNDWNYEQDVFVARPVSYQTTVTLTALPSPATVGSPVTLTATLATPTPTSVPMTGQVQFFDGTTLLGTSTVSGGTAQLVVTTFTATTHLLKAVYSGDANYLGSTSPTITLVVTSTVPTSTSLTSSGSPAAAGTPVTFTAVVTKTAGGVVPEGTVTFSDGTTAIATVTVGPTGTATTTTASLGAGTHLMTARYNGTVNYAASTSPTFTQVITTMIATSTSLTSSGSPATAGTPVTFTAVVTKTGDGVVTEGTVTFSDGTTPIATVAVGSTGVATTTTASLSVGSHAMTARFNGTSTLATSTSPTFTQVISSVAPTADLSVNVTGPGAIRSGKKAMFQVTITNNGPAMATGITTTVIVRNGTMILAGKTWTWSALPVGYGRQYNYQVKLVAPVGSVLTVEASVSSVSTDPQLANNTAQTTAYVYR